jgi:hypothetical protein
MIFELGELTLTKAELKALPSEHRDFLFVSEIATNDLVFFGNITAMCGNMQDSDKVIQTYITSRWINIIKHTSAKIYEFGEAYKAYRRKLAKYSKNKRPKEFNINGIEASRFYALSKVMRNNFVFHYESKEYQKYLDKLDDDQAFTSYLAVANGNTLHSIGDELSVLSPLRNFFEEDYAVIKSDEELVAVHRKHLHQYVSWCVDCSSLIVRWQQDFMIWILQNYYNGRSICLKKHNVKNELTYNPRAYFIPIFAR